MLAELSRHFTSRGWYSGTHPFLSLRLEGGFEAFSGKASETWEYRWIIYVHENIEIGIPALTVRGNVYETLDQLADRTLDMLITEEQKIKDNPPASKGPVAGFVDWNQFSMDELAEYLEDKHKYSSSGEALAIHKLVAFYQENKHKSSKYNLKITEFEKPKKKQNPQTL